MCGPQATERVAAVSGPQATERVAAVSGPQTTESVAALCGPQATKKQQKERLVHSEQDFLSNDAG